MSSLIKRVKSEKKFLNQRFKTKQAESQRSHYESYSSEKKTHRHSFYIFSNSQSRGSRKRDKQNIKDLKNFFLKISFTTHDKQNIDTHINQLLNTQFFLQQQQQHKQQYLYFGDRI